MHVQPHACFRLLSRQDPSTVAPILRGLLRAWPWSSSAKQIVFLNEVEELLEMAGEA